MDCIIMCIFCVVCLGGRLAGVLTTAVSTCVEVTVITKLCKHSPRSLLHTPGVWSEDTILSVNDLTRSST